MFLFISVKIISNACCLLTTDCKDEVKKHHICIRWTGLAYIKDLAVTFNKVVFNANEIFEEKVMHI
jgi:hypothetical protein